MGWNRAETNIEKARARDILERVRLAVETLCVEKGDVRSRLVAALRYYLVPLQEQDFPTRLRSTFRNVMEQSTKFDASDRYRAGLISVEMLSPEHRFYEGPIDSTMRRIRRSTGEKIARDIWYLYSELTAMVKGHRM